jgi:hypothetical protein
MVGPASDDFVHFPTIPTNGSRISETGYSADLPLLRFQAVEISIPKNDTTVMLYRKGGFPLVTCNYERASEGHTND